MQFQIGERVGDYEIVAVLGAGGMGRVYKVRNVFSDRMEAMKVLLPNLQEDPSLADRFLREIKVQAGLSHPNIAQLFTALQHNNQLLMLMEFVEGVSIEKMLSDVGRLPVDQTIAMSAQVLQALGYAHSRGVVHRDIKPANIVVMPDGTVKLMDFGIARTKADKKLTATGLTVGSLYYISPEQINGQLEPDPRSDIYSLGITMYEMVTGKKPFEGSSEYSVMAGHLQTRPSAPIEIVPNVPPLLNEIILMALAKEPQGRFQSADAFRTALLNVEGSMRPAAATRKAPTVQVPVAAAPGPVAPLPVAAHVAAAGSAPPSSRGLWMGLGSLVGVGVVLLGLFQLPKFFSSKADSPQNPPVQEQPAAQVTPPVSQPAAQTQPLQQQAAPESREPANRTPIQQEPVKPQTTTQEPVSKPAEAVQTPPPQTAPAVTPPVVTPAKPAVDQAALDAQQDRMIKMSARASAVLQKLKRLESSQNTQGLGMRADFKSAQARLEQYLDLAETALKSGNVAAAKTNMDRADRDIEFLEEKLGI